MDRIVMFPGPMQEPARVPEAGPRLIGAGHASMLCGLSEAQMARLAEAGAFPRGLRVEQPGRRRGGVTLYAEAEIRAWIAERLRERDERAASADGGRGPSGSPRR